MQPSIVITGANGGIGRVTTSFFVSAGYRVIAIDRQFTSGFCEKALTLNTDLSLYAMDEKYREIVNSKILDLLCESELKALINNAAVQRLATLGDITQADWDESLAVNLSTPLWLTQLLLKKLEVSTGCVINIGSIHENQTKPEFVAYATSKAALIGLTKALSVDIGCKVRCFGVNPAAIETPMLLDGFKGKAQEYSLLKSYHPVNRIGTPSDLVKLLQFLVESNDVFMNGSVINYDGGIRWRLHDPA